MKRIIKALLTHENVNTELRPTIEKIKKVRTNRFLSMRSLLVIAALFTITSSFAQSNLTTQVTAAGRVTAEVYPGSTDGKFVLILNNPYGEKVYMYLKNSVGKVYQKTTWKKSLRTIFDLSQVEDDDYTITVCYPGNSVSKSLELKTEYAVATRSVQIK